MTASGSPPASPPDYAAALTSLAHRGREAAVVAVEGPDREAFLQGQITQDVRGLAPGAARRAAGLSPRGKLLYFGWLAAESDRLLLVLPGGRLETVLAHLAKYAVFQKVAVRDATPDFALFALYGPAAGAFAPAPGAVRLAAEGEIAASVLAPARERNSLESLLARAGSAALSPSSSEILRVEAGRPRFGLDADESNLPAEIGLDDAISTTKGCYVGQEIVARMRTYGRPSRRLVGFRFEGAPASAGTTFPDPARPDHELGRVTSSALSPRFGAIGLGFAARDVPDGAALGGAGGAAAVVTPLPFA